VAGGRLAAGEENAEGEDRAGDVKGKVLLARSEPCGATERRPKGGGGEIIPARLELELGGVGRL